MLILGREEAEVAGVGSEVAEPGAAFVSEVEVMQHSLADATDTMTRGPLRWLQELAFRAAWKSGAQLTLGTLTTIEPMTKRPARIARRPFLARHRGASA
jgi:hypothetical protein